jgi:hypothetical protein
MMIMSERMWAARNAAATISSVASSPVACVRRETCRRRVCEAAGDHDTRVVASSFSDFQQRGDCGRIISIAAIMRACSLRERDR